MAHAFQGGAFQDDAFQADAHGAVAPAFQNSAFQNNAFQTSDDASATATVSAAISVGPGSGYGNWKGGKRSRNIERGRIRLLSELDEPLFTPEEILEAPPAFNVDEATRAAIEAQVLSAFAGVMDTALRKEMQRKQFLELLAFEQQLIDDDETFLVM